MLTDYSDDFKPIETNDPDFGYTKSKIWLKLELKNTSTIEEDWRIHFKENFKQLFDVYLVRQNFSVETVLSQDLENGFSSRPVQYPELVAPLLVQPGEQVTVLVNYWSEGASYLQLTLETGPSFSDKAAKRTAKNFIYYGMMILLIIAALICLIVYRHMVFAAYIAYSGSTLLYLMHSDGVAYQYLWPELPKFNSVASIFIGSGIIIFACTYARVFLITKKRHPIVDKLLLVIIISTLALDVASFFADNQIIKKVLVLMSLVTVSACTFAGIVAARKRFKEVRFYLLAWVGIVAASLIMNLRHWVGIELSQDFQFDFMRVVMVVDAAMMGLAIADRYNQVRNARQVAMKETLAVAERNIELSKRLSDLETKFSVISEASETKDKEIANTIHDLRQPLHALRLTVHDLVQGNSNNSDGSPEIEETFSYLEKLVSTHLEGATHGHAQTLAATEDPQNQPSTDEVLKSIHEMFLPDAAAKGLDFRYVPTSLSAKLDSLVLMRIITNIVSNAIKYTEAGSILLGCRRDHENIRIEVHDTGNGLTEDDFSSATKRNSRLVDEEGPQGNGFGLDIVNDLVKRHGLELKLCDKRRKGTGFVLIVPAS